MQVYMCDQCGAIIGDADEYVHVERNTYSEDDGWTEEGHDFCSILCVGKWATAR